MTPNVLHLSFSSCINPSLNGFNSIILSLFSNPKRMLGHKNINQTMRYAKVLAKDVQSDFEKIGSKLSLQQAIITKTKRL